MSTAVVVFVVVLGLIAYGVTWQDLNFHRKLAHRRRAAQIMALADATRERDPCPCRFWDYDTDQPDWVPCDDHLEALIAGLIT